MMNKHLVTCMGVVHKVFLIASTKTSGSERNVYILTKRRDQKDARLAPHLDLELEDIITFLLFPMTLTSR